MLSFALIPSVNKFTIQLSLVCGISTAFTPYLYTSFLLPYGRESKEENKGQMWF